MADGQKFQSTHPLRGATIPTLHSRRVTAYFNPRTPCGVRLIWTLHNCTPAGISIHAPLAGCDHWLGLLRYKDPNFNPRTPCGVRRSTIRSRSAAAANFNPRTPCGVRPARTASCTLARVFQSTHPLRGATAKLPKYSRQICAKATKFLQSQTKSGVVACWAKGKRPLFPALRGANLPGKTGTLPVRIR